MEECAQLASPERWRLRPGGVVGSLVGVKGWKGRQEAEGLQPGGCDRQADAPSLRFSSTQRVVPHLSSRGYCELRGLSGPGSLGFPRRQPGARAGASPGKGVLKAGMARTQAPGCGQRHGGSSRSGRPRSQGPRPYPEPQADLPGGREALQGMEEQLVPAVEGAAQPPRPKPCALTPLRSSLWGQNVAALPLVCCTGLRCPRADSGQHACPHSRAGAHQSTARAAGLAWTNVGVLWTPWWPAGRARRRTFSRLACEGSGHPEFPPQAHS